MTYLFHWNYEISRLKKSLNLLDPSLLMNTRHLMKTPKTWDYYHFCMKQISTMKAYLTNIRKGLTNSVLIALF